MIPQVVPKHMVIYSTSFNLMYTTQHLEFNGQTFQFRNNPNAYTWFIWSMLTLKVFQGNIPYTQKIALLNVVNIELTKNSS